MYKYLLGMVSGMTLVAWGFVVQSKELSIGNLSFISVALLGIVTVNTYVAFKVKAFQK